MVRLTKVSKISGKKNSILLDVTQKQLSDFYLGKLGLIQEAFPNLTPSEREFILSGSTAEEWNELFKDSE